MKTTPDDPFAAVDAAAARQAAEDDAAKRLAGARARLILGRDAKAAFFATLLLRLKPVVDWSVGTMATDGRVLAYSPAFVAGLAPDELLGVLAHEVMHNALCHHCRRGDRDPHRWNVACDLAINPLLAQSGYSLPMGRLMPGEGGYAGLTAGKAAEEYYAALPRDEGPGAETRDPGGCGAVTEPARLAPADVHWEEAEWQVALAQAEHAARLRGDLPAGLGRAVQEVLHPGTDWRDVLREFVSATAKNDYSWSRPNRRHVARGLYLPGLHSEELGEVVIAVDTSGSVGEKELAVFAAEVAGVLAAFVCTATILFHDTEVQSVQTWEPSDGELTLAPVGGGGTSHACVFDWVAANGANPACVVCLTDLDTEFPAAAPGMPVLWAVVGDNETEPPFGRRVAIPTTN
jgi:predicted metal-dependent peptidase